MICLDGLSNICGAGIGSGSIGMSLVCKFSGVGSCTGGSGWGFWCVAVPGDVPNEWISSARIFTSPSFTQSEPDKRACTGKVFDSPTALPRASLV